MIRSSKFFLSLALILGVMLNVQAADESWPALYSLCNRIFTPSPVSEFRLTSLLRENKFLESIKNTEDVMSILNQFGFSGAVKLVGTEGFYSTSQNVMVQTKDPGFWSFFAPTKTKIAGVEYRIVPISNSSSEGNQNTFVYVSLHLSETQQDGNKNEVNGHFKYCPNTDEIEPVDPQHMLLSAPQLSIEYSEINHDNG